MEKAVVLWDLDGTLMDTLEDLFGSVNAALDAFGLPARSRREVADFTGNGIRRLIAAAVPPGTDPALTEQVFDFFRTHYAAHCEDHTAPYDGVVALLTRFRAAGGRSAIVSNKAAFAVEQLAARHFPGLIDAVVGENEAAGLRKKPAPDMVQAALTALGATAAEAVYVGDSEVDVETAKNAGLPLLAVTWGFRSRERLVQAGATELVDTLQQLEQRLF